MTCALAFAENRDMKREWQEFFGSANERLRTRVRVTLNARGVLLLNRCAFEAIGSPGAVTLLYDAHDRTIGLREVDPAAPNAFPVKRKDTFHNYTVHTSPLCKHYRLFPTRTVRFNKPEIDNQGVLVLELGDTTAIGGLRK